MSAVCVLDTLALSVSIIQEIGNIKRYVVEIFCTMIVSPIETAKNNVLMKAIIKLISSPKAVNKPSFSSGRLKSIKAVQKTAGRLAG